MFLVDSHCHLDRLDLKPFDNQLEGALEHAREQGVGHMLCVCIDLEHLDDVLQPAQKYDFISASVGVHPNEREGRDPNVDELVKLAEHEQVVAIGETGLDYFRTKKGDTDWQQARFRNHIQAAKITGKPLIVHMREASEDTLRILEEEGAADVGGVMHCFVEDRAIAQRALDLGFYISFSGIVTFNSAKELKEVARQVPADRMLVETDSPYLAPVPYRGKSNQPAYVRQVAEHIAELRNEGLENIAELTSRNFFELFPLAKKA
ncbi:MAG TPA: TatD family deoxyribonuclease [Gammaproteobacteria bacterium]|nr:TatD family deoxyribonuclease [Gammaproteobacteria bacterium]